MAKIPVELPSLIRSCTSGNAVVEVEADTLSAALDQLTTDYPLLRNALYESDGAQRQHVLIFYNDENTRWLDTLDRPVHNGDRIIIVQSVAGG